MSERDLDNIMASVGWSTADVYSTAFAGMVPKAGDAKSPAWPATLDYLRRTQLRDGGWGEDRVYYAHDRTISTVVALRTLLAWGQPQDEGRIARGVEALHRYAPDLARENHEPIAFELLMPHILQEMRPYNLVLPEEHWAPIMEKGKVKLGLIGGLRAKCGEPRSWWFSLEMLPLTQLANIEPCILNKHGSIAASTAATAALLRAYRLFGGDAAHATQFMENVLAHGHGAEVCQLYPVDSTELAWAIDAMRRAGFDPRSPLVQGLAAALWKQWDSGEPGLSYSTGFAHNDGDDTAVGFTALRWAGYAPAEEPLLQYWNSEQAVFKTYLDERGESISAHVHALVAFRMTGQFEITEALTEKLIAEIVSGLPLDDKWHLSTYYPTGRVTGALVGIDDVAAQYVADFLAGQQNEDGGWGDVVGSTAEETSYVVLGLLEAQRHGLHVDKQVLRGARYFFENNSDNLTSPRLWIGKVLYQPVGVVSSSVFAARLALERLFGSTEVVTISDIYSTQAQLQVYG